MKILKIAQLLITLTSVFVAGNLNAAKLPTPLPKFSTQSSVVFPDADSIPLSKKAFAEETERASHRGKRSSVEANYESKISEKLKSLRAEMLSVNTGVQLDALLER